MLDEFPKLPTLQDVADNLDLSEEKAGDIFSLLSSLYAVLGADRDIRIGIEGVEGPFNFDILERLSPQLLSSLTEVASRYSEDDYLSCAGVVKGALLTSGVEDGGCVSQEDLAKILNGPSSASSSYQIESVRDTLARVGWATPSGDGPVN